MAYYRCAMSGGSGDFPVTLTVTCDSAFVGETLYLTKGLMVLSKTVPATGIVEFEFPESGTWILSNSLTSDTETFENVGEYETILYSVPDGKTVLPVNDIQTWLSCAGIRDKDYTTLVEVLADNITLSALMASNNAVDYMVRSTTWAVATALVPEMTDNTHPSGEVFSSGSASDAWKVFDHDRSTKGYMSNTEIAASDASFIGYKLSEIISVGKASIFQNSYNYPSCKIQSSDDGILYNDISLSFNLANGTESIVDTLGSGKYILLYVESCPSSSARPFVEIQFYTLTIVDNAAAMSYIGLNNYAADTLLADSTWCEAICNSEYFESVLNAKVPDMTSNTTPSGECFSVSIRSSRFDTYYAFDGDDSTNWYGDFDHSSSYERYIGYDFNEPVSIKKVALQGVYISERSSYPNTYKIQGSNDGINYTDLYSGTDDSYIEKNDIFVNNSKYSKYRLFSNNWHLGGSNTDAPGLSKLQFYGRKDI